jgi:hypothetical protein
MAKRRKTRPLKARLAVVAALASAAFLGIFGGLSWQMTGAKDPALGPKAQVAATISNTPVTRRIVKRTIVVRKIVDPAPAGGAQTSTAVSAPASSAPAPSAAPAAVAPAPAPAPVVTRGS